MRNDEGLGEFRALEFLRGSRICLDLRVRTYNTCFVRNDVLTFGNSRRWSFTFYTQQPIQSLASFAVRSLPSNLWHLSLIEFGWLCNPHA